MKEEYIQMKKLNQWDLNWFYKFYVEEFPNLNLKFINSQLQNSTHILLPIELFMQSFPQYFQLNFEMIIDYIEKKLGFIKLYNKQNQLIQTFYE